MESFLVIVLILATVLFRPKNDEEGKITDMMIPMEQIIIDAQNQISIPGLPLYKTHDHVLDATSCGVENIVQFQLNSIQIDMPPDPVSTIHSVSQVSNTSISLVGPRISTDKVQQLHIAVKSSENVSTTDRISGNISDTDSLLHQPLIEGQETSSFHIEHPNDFLPEAQEKTSRIANEPSTSHPAEQLPQEAAVAESQVQDSELETAAKLSYLVMPISAAGILAILTGPIGDKNIYLGYKLIIFNAFKILDYISLILSVLLFLFTALKPADKTLLVVIVKTTKNLTILVLVSAFTCALSIILFSNLVHIVISLVFPVLGLLVYIIVGDYVLVVSP